MKLTLALLCLIIGGGSARAQLSRLDTIGNIVIQPVVHASLVLTVGKTVIYADPSGKPALFQGLAKPDIIFITDIHGDHFDTALIASLKTNKTIIVAPPVVAAQLPAGVKVMKNGDKHKELGIAIEALPMYNLPDGPDARHPKGRGNGYVLTMDGKRIYLSGDTQGIPEMRALKNISVAFVCMNLPYTMDVQEAADAVLAFRPAIVYPYHYRGAKGLSDINAFKEKVNAGDPKIDVRLRNWYPQQ